MTVGAIGVSNLRRSRQRLVDIPVARLALSAPERSRIGISDDADQVGAFKVECLQWHQVAGLMVRAAQSGRMATARVQPADPPLTFTGRQEIVKPVGGRASRLCSFSIWQ